MTISVRNNTGIRFSIIHGIITDFVSKRCFAGNLILTGNRNSRNSGRIRFIVTRKVHAADNLCCSSVYIKDYILLIESRLRVICNRRVDFDIGEMRNSQNKIPVLVISCYFNGIA